MRTIGLTGGIGSGKSTVAHILLEAGCVVIDADAISRALTRAGGAAMPEIIALCGSEMMAADGSLNRDAMRARILEDAGAKARLEAIVHPKVGMQIDEQLALASKSGAACSVIDIPLLAEGGSRWRSRLDAVWVVDCTPATQIARVSARSGWPQEQIEAVIAAQASRADRLACADAVIVNEGLSLEGLKKLVVALVQAQNMQGTPILSRS